MPTAEFFFYPSPNGQIEGIKVISPAPNARPILFCRGGNRSLGALDDFAIDTLLKPLADAGFTVYASQYSEGGKSEGKDEFGGRDVADVHALLDVMREEGAYRDGEFLGLLGFSRGGIMGCRALRDGLPATHAAFVGGSFDLRKLESERPDLLEMFTRDRMFDVTPEELEKRSGLAFADELPQIPFLLLHAVSDASVPARQAVEMATALGERATVKLFPGDDHGLLEIPEERNRRLIEFFQREI